MLIEKLLVAHPLKEFLALYITQRIITMFTSAWQWYHEPDEGCFQESIQVRGPSCFIMWFFYIWELLTAFPPPELDDHAHLSVW
jgi:hypothetical protein